MTGFEESAEIVNRGVANYLTFLIKTMIESPVKQFLPSIPIHDLFDALIERADSIFHTELWVYNQDYLYGD